MKYQVSYRLNNKLQYGDYEAKDIESLKHFFKYVVGAEIEEIKEYINFTSNKVFNKNDITKGTYILKCFSQINSLREMKLPLVKSNFDLDTLLKDVRINFKIHNQNIENILFSVKI